MARCLRVDPRSPSRQNPLCFAQLATAMSESQSITTLLKKYKLRPRQELGQNFLIDPFHLAKIVEAAELTPADTAFSINTDIFNEQACVICRQLFADGDDISCVTRGLNTLMEFAEDLLLCRQLTRNVQVGVGRWDISLLCWRRLIEEQLEVFCPSCSLVCFGRQKRPR